VCKWVACTLLKFEAAAFVLFVVERFVGDLCFTHWQRRRGTTSHCHLRQHGQMLLGVANESAEPLTGAFFVLVNGFLHETQRRNIYSVAALLTSFLYLEVGISPCSHTTQVAYQALNFHRRLNAILKNFYMENKIYKRMQNESPQNSN
jgi:hypothetical protein